jgi:carboxypeptidase family protein
MKTGCVGSVILMVAASLVSAIGAWGQAQSSLRGSVTDRSGGTVSGASVMLSSAQTGFTREVSSAADGVYQFLDVPPGMYAVTVNAQGFKSATLNHIQLLVNTPATADVVLEVGSTSEVVTVTSEVATLNTEDATVGNAFQQNQVEQLPIESRNVVDLLSLQPGVVYLGNRSDINLSQDTRSGSVNGARSD